MLESLKAFNAAHNNMPVKVAGVLVGAAVVAGVAFVVYNGMTSDVLSDDVVEVIVDLATEAAE